MTDDFCMAMSHMKAATTATKAPLKRGTPARSRLSSLKELLALTHTTERRGEMVLSATATSPSALWIARKSTPTAFIECGDLASRNHGTRFLLVPIRANSPIFQSAVPHPEAVCAEEHLKYGNN